MTIDTNIVTALIASLPPTLAALAAFRHVRANGRGTLHAQLERIEDKVDDLVVWRQDHDRQAQAEVAKKKGGKK